LKADYIKHGILKKRENGCVKVIVKKIDKDIEVVIEDDGVGIEQTVIDNLDKKIQEKKLLETAVFLTKNIF